MDAPHPVIVTWRPVSSPALLPRKDSALSDWGQSLRALLERVQTGDKGALEAFYDQTRQLVYSLALRILREEGAAEEVTIDVYLEVYRRAAEFDAGRGGVLAWLMTLTRSRSIDRLRSRSARDRHLDRSVQIERIDPSPEGTTDARDQEQALALQQARLAVQLALGKLSAEQRQVIERAYFDGLSGQEIANELGLPLGTVKSRLRLAIMNLRQSLGPLAETLVS